MKTKGMFFTKALFTLSFIGSCSMISYAFTPGENMKSFPEIGVCTSFSNAEMLKKHGYSFIEENVGRFLVPFSSEEEFDKILDKYRGVSLPIKAFSGFIPGNLKSVGPDAPHKKVLEYMETAFRRAQKAGVEIIVFGSGGSRSIPEGFSPDDARKQFIELCSKMAPIAKKYNVVVVLEPLNSKECNFINSIQEGGAIVEEVNHSNFRLLADIYHMMIDNEGPESIIKYGHLIKHIHIAEKQGRAAPGTHNEDLSAYYDALKQAGYRGLFSIECRWENIEEQAARAIEIIISQLLSTE